MVWQGIEFKLDHTITYIIINSWTKCLINGNTNVVFFNITLPLHVTMVLKTLKYT